MRALDHHDPDCNYNVQSHYNGEDGNDRRLEQALDFCDTIRNEWMKQLFKQNNN